MNKVLLLSANFGHKGHSIPDAKDGQNGRLIDIGRHAPALPDGSHRMTE